MLRLCIADWCYAENTEIDGLILDQTQTKTGHDFYRHFVTLWEAPPGIENYNIFIVERATPQWGSWVWIKVNDSVIYKNILKPKIGEMDNTARKAVEAVRQYLYWLKDKNEIDNGGGQDETL